jgi:hypothetical protein
MTENDNHMSTNLIISGLLMSAGLVTAAMGMVAESDWTVFASVWIVLVGAFFAGRYMSERAIARREEQNTPVTDTVTSDVTDTVTNAVTGDVTEDEDQP